MPSRAKKVVRWLGILSSAIRSVWRSISENVPLLIGIITTFAWLTFAMTFLLRRHRLADFDGLKLNEFGDFVAGVSAPIAFVWLVVAVLMQRQELQMQRKEMEHNREVLKLQIEELKVTSTEMRNQTTLLESENYLRIEQDDFISWKVRLYALLQKMGEIDLGRNRNVITTKVSSSIRLACLPRLAEGDIVQNLRMRVYDAIIAMEHCETVFVAADAPRFGEQVPRSAIGQLEACVNSLVELVFVASMSNAKIAEYAESNSLGKFVERAKLHLRLIKRIAAASHSTVA